MVTPARYCMRETRNNVQSSRHGIVRNRRQSGRLRDFVLFAKFMIFVQIYSVVFEVNKSIG